MFSLIKETGAVFFTPLLLGLLCYVRPSQTVLKVIPLIVTVTSTTFYRGAHRGREVKDVLKVTQLESAGKPRCGWLRASAWHCSDLGAGAPGSSLSHSGWSVRDEPLQTAEGQLEDPVHGDRAPPGVSQ